MKRASIKVGTRVVTTAGAQAPGVVGEVVEITPAGYRIRWADGEVDFGIWSELSWAQMAVVSEGV